MPGFPGRLTGLNAGQLGNAGAHGRRAERVNRRNGCRALAWDALTLRIGAQIP
ncbi:hypothetical protein METH_14590 [Leisingera methylohalidivorans DSM 14336]|uniref:Uncharacterized protein n=1 Tax=Leisingera methylohalidivorans DSM 14336 TaxID=999552 RepID=V9W1V0_9RHOB|nr:hypothetical protein METH_14590 [Leisingera methylohalidivorans DSM 14336]